MTRQLTWVMVLLLAGPAMGRDWYQWRGPEQNGVSREHGLPETWTPDGENQIWQNDLGGMSSPIVMNGMVYTITRTGEEKRTDTLVAGPMTQEVIAAADALTGKTIWTYKMDMTQTEVPFHRLGWSNVTGDPVTGRVYAFGAQCNFVCLDGKTGKLIWLRQMTEEFGMISTFGGRTPSPAVDEDQVFICGVAFGWGDNARAQYRVFALDKNTGELNWTSGTGGLPVDAPYQTPTITVVNGQKELVTGSGDGGVYGFQPRTGKLLWKYIASKRGMNSSVLVNGSRVYICHGEVNITSSAMGSVMCIDVGGPAVKEVWRVDGIEAGFASPTMHDGRLFVMDDSSVVYDLNADTGQELWHKRCGTIGKASLVWADDKLYVPEANGHFWIFKITDKGPQKLCKVDLEEKLGREYVIFGSVAIANGRVYLEAANKMYCIGAKDVKVQEDELPAAVKEDDGGSHEPAVVQVRPADVEMKVGEKKQFTLKFFDAMGRPAKEPADLAKADWSVAKLVIPPPPSTAPSTQPVVMAGNLLGAVDAGGLYTSAAGPIQGGAVAVEVGPLKGNARVRVFPPLPWKFDFEKAPLDAPPLTWLGAGGKFWVKDLENNHVLDKVPQVDLYYRARTNFGTPDMANYTVQADVRTGEKIMGGEHQIPDPGIIDQRYVLQLYGTHQRLQIHKWAGALPTEMSASASLNKTIEFEWKANTWYTMKLEVQQKGEKAVARGKVWPAGEKEPDAWTIQVEDPIGTVSGNPGLFGHSLVTPYKSDIYYDNIIVTENKP